MIRGSPNFWKPQNLHMAICSVCCCSLIVNVSSAMARTYPIFGNMSHIPRENQKKLVLFENTPISFMVYQHISLFKIVKMLGKYAKKQTHPVVSRL